MNPRQNGSDADTAAMAQSIAINGLMQNLMGYADPDHPGKIGIVAGGRRLHALQQLQSTGSGLSDSKEPDWDAIPVQVTNDAFLAQSWAGTESATQKPLHPADEIRAYAAMADQGNSPETIARAFAQTNRHVKGRLALAGLVPEALDALRAGHISLDVAKALTLARDNEQQLSVLTVARSGNWLAHRVRMELTQKAVSSTDRKVRYVTLELYKAEGGTMDDDLFEDQSYLHDGALIDRLFTEKLAMEAESIQRTEGWQWVKTTQDSFTPYGMTEKLFRIYRTHDKLPDGDQAEYDELEELTTNATLDPDSQSRLEGFEARMAGDYTDEDRETGGIVVLVGRDGKLQIEGAYQERARQTKSGAGDGTSPTTGPAKPALTQAGAEDLRRISLLALQGAMIDKTELLLDLFAWQMARGAPTWSSPFAITLTDQPITPEVGGSWHMDARLTDPLDDPDHNTDPAAAFNVFLGLGKRHRNKVLARGLTRTLQHPSGSMTSLGRLMADFAGVNIRKVWTPDAPTYFSRLRPEMLEILWFLLLGLHIENDADRIADFARLKKAEKAKELEALFADASVQEAHGLSRDQIAAIDTWLPPEMMAETS